MTLICCLFLLFSSVSEANPRLVKMYKVGKQDDLFSFSYPAVIDAGTTAYLSFPMSGRIDKLLVRESQQVKKGQILAQLDQVVLKADLNAALSNLQRAKTELARAERLIKEQAISKQELEKRRNEKKRNYEQVRAARKRIKDSVLRAPFAGYISLVPVKQDQTVQATEKVATLIDNTKVDAVTNIPAKIVSKVKQREGAIAIVTLDSAPDRPLEAVFREASLQADTVTQTYEVLFRFTPPPELVVLPGMNARVILNSRNSKEFRAKTKVTVPLPSIFTEQGKHFVWKVNPKTKKVNKTEVSVGSAVGANIPITKGLRSGDIVVGAGVSYLSEGAEVKAWKKESVQQ